MRIEWHPDAVTDLLAIATADQRRIKAALDELSRLEDARQRLVPYSGNLKGFCKLRCGAYRLVCELLRRDGTVMLIVHLAHRSRAYSKRGQRTIKTRTGG
ncbi:type II toxin-antitoxin system RelE family toxin [Oceaniradius stylonematis]|uniref:type II toxin-antitoxin system RelE family toxin n=1 Tax=Oceaniradius stylonematis TaxID=2184161 RepID=UPI0027400F61|nr:type II toxin-antitoxin system RelE/ParE family toxin [Oceaniradius stylonematis]